MPTDLFYIASWASLLFVLGVIFLPLTWLLFKNFTDIGYGFSKTIALGTISLIAFTLSSLNLYPILFALAILNLCIFLQNKKGITSSIKSHSKILLSQEIIFLLGLIFWSFIRAHQPEIRGLEKFMDYGFINSILKSLPPEDMWFAGSQINYYWFGHLISAVATKLSHIPASVTYNLMIATIAGLTLSAAFSIISTLTQNPKKLKLGKGALLAGLISAVLLTFGGNLHTPLYVIKEGADKYWYPDATRFIGYNPDVDDKTIHEFPLYSFVVSDLHAHLLSLPLVLLFIASVYKIISAKNSSAYKTVINSLPSGIILGTIAMTNAWDLANYALFTFTASAIYFFFTKDYKKSSLFLITIAVTSAATAAPFLLNFNSVTQGVKLVHSHSPLWQLAILWGFPAILTLIYLISLIPQPSLIKKSDMFILSLLATSWLLILIPEVIYIKDIYAGSHYRANTMFKLTYQAFVMFYLSSGYIMIRSIKLAKNAVFRHSLATSYLLLTAMLLTYPYLAIKSYYNKLENYQGLNGESWLLTQHPESAEAIAWLRQNIPGKAVILEAPGDSYTDANVISAYTGNPAPLGWFVHEWLWRGSAEIPQQRATDVEKIYTSQNLWETEQLLKKYKVEYVIVGESEKQKYPNLNEDKIKNLGPKAFSFEGTSIYKISI